MVSDRWNYMVERQREFQRTVWEGAEETNISVTKELVLGIISEADELLREIAWKAKRRITIRVKPHNVLEELVDMLKYVLAIAAHWGFSADEIFDAYLAKSEVVEQRWRQEYPLWEIIQSGAKVVVLDIDGVLSDWPFCFYNFLIDRHWIDPCEVVVETQNPFEALPVNPLTIRSWKHLYRESGYKRELATIDGAVAFTQEIRKRGFKIVLVTSRPYHEYSRIFADTLFWLDHEGFAFDAIMWSDRKEERLAEEFDLEQIAMFVDDNPENVDMVAGCGVPAALLIRPYNSDGLTFEQILEVLDES